MIIKVLTEKELTLNNVDKDLTTSENILRQIQSQSQKKQYHLLEQLNAMLKH